MALAQERKLPTAKSST